MFFFCFFSAIFSGEKVWEGFVFCLPKTFAFVFNFFCLLLLPFSLSSFSLSLLFLPPPFSELLTLEPTHEKRLFEGKAIIRRLMRLGVLSQEKVCFFLCFFLFLCFFFLLPFLFLLLSNPLNSVPLPPFFLFLSF